MERRLVLLIVLLAASGLLFARDVFAAEPEAAGAQPSDPRVRRVAKFLPLIRDAAARHGVDPNLIVAIILSESGGDPNAVGSVGEIGLGQILPSTARSLGLSGPIDQLFDPAVNVEFMARLLRELGTRFGGDVESIVAHYKAGRPIRDASGNFVVPPHRVVQKVVGDFLTITV